MLDIDASHRFRPTTRPAESEMIAISKFYSPERAT